MQKFVNEDTFGIDAEEVDPTGNFGGDVFVEKFEGADAHGEQGETFEKFESGD